MKRKFPLLICCLLAGLFCGCGGGAGTSAAPAATVAGVTIVEETGLLEVEELPEDTFAVEIMPEADDNIAEMQIMYYGGSDHAFLGQLVLAPQTDRYFTRQDTFRRGFTVPDSDLLEDFTFSFVLVDEEGNETEAQNDYAVDAGYGMTYFIKISGSKDSGYTLRDH